MVDIPAPPTLPPVPPAVAAQIQAPPPVEVTVISVPDRIEQLLRQIQVSATVTQPPNEGTLILNSIIGQLALQLPKLADSERQKLTQQLTNLVQTQKPVTVLVQPGNPPTQAFVFLPSSQAQAQNMPRATPPSAPLDTPSSNPIVQLSDPAVSQPRIAPSIGIKLSAIILPSSLPSPSPLSSAPPISASSFAPNTSLPPLPPLDLSPLPTSPAPLAAPPNLTSPLPPLGLQTALAQEVPQPVTGQPTAIPSSATLPALEPVSAPSFVPQTMQAPNASQLLSILQAGGNDVSLQIDAVYPPLLPNSPTPPALPAPAPNQILATVINNGPNGQVLLQANDFTLYVKQPLNITQGTQLMLTVDAPQALPLHSPSANSGPDFSNLQSTLTALAQINPQLAQQVAANHIPQVTTALQGALPGALLFFMSAIKQSNVRTWLGDDAVDALNRAGKFELISKLSQNLSDMGENVRDPVVGEWKAYPIPVQQNNQFQIMNFYVHNSGERRSDDATEPVAAAQRKHTRFVIDVRMSQLGAMQLDGFIQPKKLDIIVRSERSLPESLHNDLRQVYTKALTGIDYAGSLNFQVGRNSWLMIHSAGGKAAVVT